MPPCCSIRCCISPAIDLSIEEIKRFRQFGSKTPGHPEREAHLGGVETTTGPLGQGFANAVGMAIAERSLAATFNRPGHEIIDHHTYVFMGDGCMMEGISHEAASLAGMQKLGKLIAVYDNNGISIDGKVVGWFDDNTAERFEAYGWHVLPHVDGNDRDAVAEALAEARAVTDRPSLICAQDHHRLGRPEQAGHAVMHGEAHGKRRNRRARENLTGHRRPSRFPPTSARNGTCARKAQRAEQEWQQPVSGVQGEFPELAAELERRMSGTCRRDSPTRRPRT